MTKTVVFGLDGACWDLVQPWLDDGRLPTLTDVIERGGRAPLESCVPATTPPAWTSLTTGMNPGKHGVFGFYERQRDTYEVSPVSDRSVHARRLWDYLSEAGQGSLVVNVPVTHPPREFDGVLVPGYLSPDPPETHPSGVLSEIGFEDYRVYAASEADDVPAEQLLEEWLELTRSRGELAQALIERETWELLFLEFQKTDGAMHKFDDREKVREIFECVDDCMADVLDAIDEQVNVVVVSDHGIGQQKEWAVALNTWLQDEGYLETTSKSADRKEWLETALASDEVDEAATENSSSLADSLARMGLTRQRIERLLSTLGLYDVARKFVPDRLKSAVGSEVVDHAASTAFYEGMGFSGVDTGVVINEAAFYQDGIVSKPEYEEVYERLIGQLEDLSGPVGSAFESVWHRSEVYNGPWTAFAPDIVLEQAPQYVIGSTQPRGKVFIETEPGRIDHTREGLITAAGPDIEEGWDLPKTPSILDVTPTLVHLHGGAVATQSDGAVLDSMMCANRSVKTREYEVFTPSEADTVSAEERESMEERLKQMGYL